MPSYVARIGWPAEPEPVGAKWYVRPLGTNYGAEDGTSYATAWEGFAAIQWASIEPGDTLYVAGTHTVPNTGFTGSSYFNIKKSGTADRRITVASCETQYGASTDDAGIIWGARLWPTTGWTGPTNGVYSRTLTSITADVSVNYAIEADETVLHNATSVEDCEATPGSFYAASLGTTIYYHPTDALQELYYYGSHAISVEGYSYITLKGLSLNYGFMRSGVIVLHRETRTYSVAGFKIQNCTIRYGQYRAVEFQGVDFTDVEMTDCTVVDCAAGFYPVTNWGTLVRYASNVLVARNTFQHTSKIADRTVFYSASYGDQLAIGIQGGIDDFTIVDNQILDWHGMGINIWLGYGTGEFAGTITMHDLLIARNEIHMNSSEAGVCNGGVIYSGINAANFSNRSKRGKIVNNLITGCAFSTVQPGDDTSWCAAIRLKQDKPTDAADTLLVANNTIVGAYYGVRGLVWDAALPFGGKFQNNIFMDPDTGGYFINHGNDSDQSGISLDYNCYHGTGKWKWDGGTDITSFASWQAAHAHDDNSFTDDPLFTGASDYTLQSGSPCVNAGTNTGLTDDLAGNPRPVGAYDIGAYERQ